MEEIESMLRALDEILAIGIRAAQTAWNADSVTDRFRGLCIGQAEVEHWLQTAPGEPTLKAPSFLALPIQDCPSFKRLQRLYSLSLFDLSVLVIALAPELDLKYERLYAYLQDDVTRKRPTVDLALNLLSSSAAEKFKNRHHFSADAPLLRHRIVRLIADTNQTQPPLLAHSLKLDEQFVRMLIGDSGTDSRLMTFSHVEEVAEWNSLPLNPGIRAGLVRMVAQARAADEKIIFLFQSSSRAEMQQAAQVVAENYCVRLMRADLAGFTDNDVNLDESLQLILNEARVHDAVLYLEVPNALSQSRLRRLLEGYPGSLMLSFHGKHGHFSVDGHRTITVDFPPLQAEERLVYWEASLGQQGVDTDFATLEGLASRFRLTPEQIIQAVEEGCASAQWRNALRSGVVTGDGSPLPDELYAAARAQSASDLAGVARKLTPIYTWDDLVLPPDTMEQLREICQRVKCRDYVMGRWGFDRKLSLGKGTSALFAGPSGTGKTMAAEVIANEVKLDLFTIDLASVVSKYIGETEKNLDRIFATAKDTDAVLFFDEADALFGKRSEVRDSHDRYANLEISYLLQKMDAYEGVTILASNLRQHMDESFIRRLAFTVLFPFPEETDRSRIWRSIWPTETPLARDVDFDELAGRFKLSGGNIRNVALAAAFLAAQNGGIVSMTHLLHAVEREYQKMGKTVHARERLEADALVTL